MPKTRKRRRQNGNGGVTYRVVEVETPELLVLDDVDTLADRLDRERVEGRFVKVEPRIPASRRNTFDGPAVAGLLRAAGARGVVLAPVFIPDAKRVEAREVSEHKSSRDIAREWFASQVAAKEDTRDAALRLVLEFMDEEHL